jgi:REP element-mobilizing transposase RayT
MDYAWELFQNELMMAHYNKGLRIHAFVLMPNHYHLLASVTSFPIGPIMREMLTPLAKQMNKSSGRINQIFGGRHYKCELDSFHYFLNCHKYLYSNPLRAGLCNWSEEWKYSTLNGLLGLNKLIVPLEEDTILFSPHFNGRELDWINTPIKQSDFADFRKALEKKKFKLPRLKSDFPRHHLEHERL